MPIMLYMLMADMPIKGGLSPLRFTRVLQSIALCKRSVPYQHIRPSLFLLQLRALVSFSDLGNPRDILPFQVPRLLLRTNLLSFVPSSHYRLELL